MSTLPTLEPVFHAVLTGEIGYSFPLIQKVGVEWL